MPDNKVIKKSGLTRIQFEECSYTWIIQNFSHELVNEFGFVKPLEFTTGKNDEYKWSLIVFYLNGYDEETGDDKIVNMSLHLNLEIQISKPVQGKDNSNTDDKFYDINIVISFIDRDGKEVTVNKQFFDEIEADGEDASCKFQNLLNKELIFDKRNGFLPNDQLTLDCKLYFYEGIEKYSNPNDCCAIKDIPSENRLEEYQYLNLIKRIIEKGAVKTDHTGTGTHSVFGTQIRFSLRDGIFPLLTTTHVFWRGVVEELLWFIKGSTNAKELSDKDVHIWDQNSSKKFLDSRGFTDREEGDLGPVYGFQWRHFGAKYKDMNTDYTGQGVDQLKDVIDKIKNKPDDRRIIMCAWNPVDIPIMAVPPCHALVQFYVADGELSCQLYQRSAEMGTGVPFIIALYSLLTYMIAHITNLKPGEFVHTMGDCHVYLDQVNALKKQISRKPKPFPKLKITREVKTIDDFQSSDFQLDDYHPHAKTSMPMAV